MSALNWQLLIICLAALVLTTVYLFYLNRILAWIAGALIRISTWSKDKDRVYIDIESVTVSLLKGTISLKNFRYHTSNQTIKLAKCSIIWRYWLRHPKGLDEGEDSEAGLPGPSKRENCRVHVAMEGMEWLMYNRMAAFDDMIAKMAFGLNATGTASVSQTTSISNGSIVDPEMHEPTPNVVVSLLYRLQAWLQSWVPSFEFRDLLPITFEVSRAALVVGNKATTTLLLGQFHYAFGQYSIAKALSPLDQYKQIITVTGDECKLFFRENANFVGSMHSQGKAISSLLKGEDTLDDLYFESFSPKTRKSEAAPGGRDGAATAERIFHANIMHVTYLADVAGVVVADHEGEDQADMETSPEWKVGIEVDVASIRYGPWADRQRAELQRIFFPPSFQDSVMTKQPRPGQTRLFESLKILFEVKGSLVIQIPFHEASKNSLWESQGKLPGKRREPAILHVKCGAGSGLQYLLPFTAEEDGFVGRLDVALSSAAFTTSASDIVFLDTHNLQISASMPSPLKWDDARTWSIDIIVSTPAIHLVRDHINFFTDLIKDWSAGPPSNFHTWIPIVYTIQLEFRDYALHLFVNDHNIIDYPHDPDENAKLTLTGQQLRSDVRISSDRFRPDDSTVPFAMESNDMDISLTLPKWDTRSIFACLRTTRVGRIAKVRLDGSFRYFSDVQFEHVDTLQLNIQLRGLIIKALGWFIRRLMILRENYFGDFTNFTTLSEYMSKKERGIVGDPVVQKGPANLFEFVLELSLLDSLLVLPAGLPGFEDAREPLGSQQFKEEDRIGLAIIAGSPDAQLSTRNTDHGMDFSFNISPWTMDVVEDWSDNLLSARSHYDWKRMIIGDGLEIVANRLFGPRPATATYFCLWEVNLGRLAGRLTPKQLLQVYVTFQAFTSNYKDILNSPSPEFSVPSDPDVTVLHVHIHSLSLDIPGNLASVWVLADRPLHLQFQNIPGPLIDKVMALAVPDIKVHVLSGSSGDPSTRQEVGYMSCKVEFKDLEHKHDHVLKAHARRSFELKQDESTQRVTNLFSPPGAEKMTHAAGTSAFLPSPIQSKPPSAPRSTRQSEKDISEDDDISDPVRDARLAKIRLDYRHHNPYGDDSMTSGDEMGGSATSTENLTDSDSGHGEDGLYSSYQHYLSQFVRTQDSMDGLPARPYSCKHERRSRLIGELHAHAGSPPPVNDPNHPGGALNGGTIAKVVVIDRGVLFITPLLSDAVSDMSQSLFNQRLSLELSVDQLLIGLLSPPPKSKTCPVSFTELRIQQLDMWALSSGRPMNMPRKHPSEHGRQAPTDPDALLLLIRVSSLKFCLGESNDVQKEFVLRGSTIMTKLYDVRRRPFRNSFLVQDSSTLSLSVDAISLGRHLNSTFGHVGNLDIRFSHGAPRHGLSIWSSYAGAFRTAKSAIVKQIRSLSQFRKFALWSVLDQCQELSIVNPLSLVKRSHLVQRQSLRTGVSYNMLTYLRICLAAIGLEVKDEIIAKSFLPRPKIPLSDIEPLLRRRWGEWTNDADSAQLVELPLLNALYGKKNKSFVLRGARSAGNLSLTVTHIGLKDTTFPDDQSSLDIGPLSVVSLIRDQQLPEADVPGSEFGKAQSFTRSLSLSFALGNFVIHLFPSFLELLQESLRVSKSLPKGGRTRKVKPQKQVNQRSSQYVEVYARVDRLRIRASAQNLLLDTGVSDCTATLVWLSSTGGSTEADNRAGAISATAKSREFFIRARSAAHASQDDGDNILASTLSTSCMLSARVKYYSSDIPPCLHGFCSAGRVIISVPKSARRTYQFIDEWRADFLPPIINMVQALVTEFKPPPGLDSKSPTTTGKATPITFTLDVRVSRFDVTLQITHGMWLAWNFTKIVVGFGNNINDRSLSVMQGTLGIESQSISVESSSTGTLGEDGVLAVKLVLPSLKLLTIATASRIRAQVEVEYFKMQLKPTHFDDLLMAQRHLGSTFDDLLKLMSGSRGERMGSTLDAPNSTPKGQVRFDIAFTLKGFQIGIPSPTTTLFLNSSNIFGSSTGTQSFAWNLHLNDFSLSLAPQSTEMRSITGSGVHHRSAFILLDLEWLLDDSLTTMKVTKLHAVMSPSSISEFGDLLDFFQLEMRHRQEQRAAELADIRSRTRSLLRTFESETVVPKASPAQPMWLAQRTVKVEIVRLGIAFPLAHSSHDVFTFREPRFTQSSLSVRAFLFSVGSVSFEARRAVSGTAKIENLSFQFVPKFNQASPRDFDGLTHESLNRLLYPSMVATLSTEIQTKLRRLTIEASISGFVLDLEPSVVDYVFALVDVYRHGKERFERLIFLTESDPGSPVQSESYEKSELMTLPTSNILMSLHFISGTVILHTSKGARSSWGSDAAPRGIGHADTEEEIGLPSLSVWAEFRATSASNKADSVESLTPAQLAFKSVIHASHNQLRPSLLQFVAQLTTALEHHLRHDLTRLKNGNGRIGLPVDTVKVGKEGNDQDTLMSSLTLIFSVRIDQSRLELTCLPDVNVLAALQWESGGFVVVVSPGARSLTFTGTVAGLSASIRHGYLLDKCAEIDARNLSFSVTFSKVQTGLETWVNSVSVVLDTELSASLRLSRLQDVLCFRAVWLDRIPVLKTEASGPVRSSPLPRDPEPTSEGFVTALLLRARTLKLVVDMGSNITEVQLVLHTLLARTHLTEVESEVELHVKQVDLTLLRNLSGSATTPDFRFHTVRRRHGSPTIDQGKAKTLQMTMTSGTLDALLMAEGRRILHYHTEPLKVVVFDDLSDVATAGNISPQLNLVFSVSGGSVIAMSTIGTIPRLLDLVSKIRSLVQEQKERAVDESELFRYAQSLKPENPLTAVANAMIQSAKTRFSDSDAVRGYIMVQRMSLLLEKLQLAIFYRNITDSDMALFTGTMIHANLDYVTDSQGASTRNDLHLSLQSMSIAKVSSLNHTLVSSLSVLATSPDWLQAILKDSFESTIFKLPALDIRMSSRDVSAKAGGNIRLEYEFRSKFPLLELDGDPSLSFVDTEVSLNIQLYKWLAEFRARLSAELARVNARNISASSFLESGSQAIGVLDSSRSIPDSPPANRQETTRDRSQTVVSGQLLNLSQSTIGGQQTEYIAVVREIERPTIRQLGDATPDILHPFFSKRAGFSVEEQLPVYIHEYATLPLEQIMKMLLKLYSRQFKNRLEEGVPDRERVTRG